MNSYKAQGIVLHTIKYGDSSLIVSLLTDTIGRQSYIVQGIRSRKGNKSAILQPMFPVEFEGLTSTRSQLDRMKDLRLSYPLKSIPFDVRKSTISLFMAETLDKLIRETEPAPELFAFIRDSVLALDCLTEGVSNFHLWFLVRMSAFLGFRPANCYSEGDMFDIIEGSFTSVRPAHAIFIDRPGAALMDAMMQCDISGLGGIELARGQRSAFLADLLRYFGYHLEAIGKIESLRILGEVF